MPPLWTLRLDLAQQACPARQASVISFTTAPHARSPAKHRISSRARHVIGASIDIGIDRYEALQLSCAFCKFCSPFLTPAPERRASKKAGAGVHSSAASSFAAQADTLW